MRGSFKNYVEENLGKFPQFLIYAVLEWVMIILLFIDGFLSFIANEYARFFELRIPCLLCTRIDHVLVNRNSGFYCNESICEVHKKDISSLAYCHVHKKLSDIRNMCEGCLLSFATGKENDFDRYNSLVGIFHKDIDTLVDDGKNFMRSGRKDDPMMQIDNNPRCFCCGELMKVVKSYPKFSRNSSMNANIAPTPSPRAPLLSSWRNDELRNLELPHFRYTELKFVPENDPELPGDEDPSGGDNHREFFLFFLNLFHRIQSGKNIKHHENFSPYGVPLINLDVDWFKNVIRFNAIKFKWKVLFSTIFCLVFQREGKYQSSRHAITTRF